MKPGSQILLVSAARLYAPLILLFGITLVAARAPGEGVGFLAGLGFALALTLHALVFGAAALRSAFPVVVMRLVLAAAVLAALAGAAGPGWRYAPQLIEAGLAAATAAGAGLVVAGLFGRVPTLRDAEW
jgi:multisubunit Na+/H+ antiporter MnhB subunit